MTEQNVSKGPHTSGMTNTPEYPFRFVRILLPENRKGAMASIDYHAEHISSACHFLMSRASKEEFLAWADSLWDEASDEFNDYMSKPHE